MKKGTKSILFGVHQFLWHPFTVWLAWIWLYKRAPSYKELVCIIIHDWGYWGKVNMDDEDGETHPEAGARIANKLFGSKYHYLCLFHSRHYARNAGVEPSALCWADKMSIMFEPWWFYLPRARMSGELQEYRELAANAGLVPLSATNREWFAWVKAKLAKLGLEKKSNAVEFMNPER